MPINKRTRALIDIEGRGQDLVRVLTSFASCCLPGPTGVVGEPVVSFFINIVSVRSVC